MANDDTAKIKAAVAELARGMRQANGWRPAPRGALAEIMNEVNGEGMQRRPHTSPESRAAA
jgi:hypothetical protein